MNAYLAHDENQEPLYLNPQGLQSHMVERILNNWNKRGLVYRELPVEEALQELQAFAHARNR